MHSRKEVELSKLVLDEENPRLNITIRREGESLEAQFLRTVEPKQIITLMESMLQEMSFNPSNIFSVIKTENDNFLVLDGNRRTLASMILASTANINNEEVDKFKKNNVSKIKLFLNNNKKIYCTIYETREEAMKWIDMNHLFSDNGVSTLRWETFARRIAEKNKFSFAFKALLDQAKIEIKKLSISYTVFERLFEDKDIKIKFDITKDEKGDFNIGNRKAFLNFVHFLNDKKYNVQMVFNKDKKIKAYNTFITDQENESKNSDMKQNSNIISEQIKFTPKKAEKTNVYIFKNSKIYIKNDKLKKVISQIEKLSLSKYTELISICVRTIVEITCWEFLTKKLGKKNKWLNDNDLKTWFSETITNLKKTGYLQDNKTTMNFLEKKFDNLVSATNGDIHDVLFFSTKKELEDNLKRVTIFLEETWRKIN